jgi:transcriptional regulator with XRE-family HTH domain
MMDLTQYLKAENLTQAQFAERINVRQSTVSKLCSGVTRPSLDMALVIESATGGLVPVAAWSDRATAARGAA